jgi:hypothetical protein
MDKMDPLHNIVVHNKAFMTLNEDLLYFLNWMGCVKEENKQRNY